MGKKVTLGGDRLGSGKRQRVELREYERSTHDLSQILRTTMSPGTLVPFAVDVALPGDTFDIDLDADVKTLPTVGPLFGSFKLQLDYFQVPIRLFQRKLQMNQVGIGLTMDRVTLPTVQLRGVNPSERRGPIDNQQVNPSSIFSYLNIRGLGYSQSSLTGNVGREFNAVSWLAYWEIFKQYYANKQEENAFVIHNPLRNIELAYPSARIYAGNEVGINYDLQNTDPADQNIVINIWRDSAKFVLLWDNETDEFEPNRISISINDQIKTGDEMWETWVFNKDAKSYTGTGFRYGSGAMVTARFGYYNVDTTVKNSLDNEPELLKFPLSNIDEMRERIMSHAGDLPFEVDKQVLSPYYDILTNTIDPVNGLQFSLASNQEGLAVKTYMSDLFNNWMSTEWLDGENGINEITKIVIGDDGAFKVNDLNLMNKLFNMLNGIALSGGSLDDWQEAVYNHERQKQITSPVYLGGMSEEIVFQEVIANTEAEGQPLGQLGGRGVISNGKKGGKIRVKVDEHSYLIGIVSITPRVDYSQGNKWDTGLKTLNDFHKPGLDGIGFQELITDQMAWWDTIIMTDGTLDKRSAGKQPSWINYMTNVNQTKGNFAEENDQMFMTLNRRYETAFNENGGVKEIYIKDLTTYIDPVHYNHIFAETRRDAQNFWIQIRTGMQARRKMSAKQIPNL